MQTYADSSLDNREGSEPQVLGARVLMKADGFQMGFPQGQAPGSQQRGKSREAFG